MPKLPEDVKDYTAPWEKDGAEFQPEKAKEFAFGLLKQIETGKSNLTRVTGERDALQVKVDAAADADKTDTQKLQDQLKTAKDEAKSAKDTAAENLRLSVALEKGLTRDQARRLIGTTEDELLADADTLIASFGGSGKTGDDETGEKPPRGTPRRLRNPADPEPDADVEVTFDTAVDKVRRVN